MKLIVKKGTYPPPQPRFAIDVLRLGYFCGTHPLQHTNPSSGSSKL